MDGNHILQDNNGHSTTTNYYNGWRISISLPNNEGTITAYNASSRQITVTWDDGTTPTLDTNPTYAVIKPNQFSISVGGSVTNA